MAYTDCTIMRVVRETPGLLAAIEGVLRNEQRPIIQPRQLLDLIASRAPLKHEEVLVLILDSQLRLMDTVTMSVGGATTCAISVQGILLAVLRAGHTNFIISHNHPAGTAQPSPADNTLTWALSAAADVCGMSFHDHIITCGAGVFQYATQGLMRSPY